MSRGTRELPAFIEPMLAKSGQAFDSPEYAFEIKWDGTRVMAYIDAADYRLLNRRRAILTARYPEFDFLSKIEPGTVLDGEVVVLRDGKPDFSALMAREHARSSMKIRNLSRAQPAAYMVFDLLYQRFRSIMDEPFHVRRARLSKIVNAIRHSCLILSEATVGDGAAYFQEVAKLGLEGMVAKRLDSRYLPGQRTDAWIKVKKGEIVSCAILGYEPDGPDDFRSLIIAAEEDGVLRPVGKVGTGIDAELRKKLNALMRARHRAKPFVPCKIKGKWIEPGLYCLVHCLERSANGTLRMPVFKGLIEER